jgi:hypothetical protein
MYTYLFPQLISGEYFCQPFDLHKNRHRDHITSLSRDTDCCRTRGDFEFDYETKQNKKSIHNIIFILSDLSHRPACVYKYPCKRNKSRTHAHVNKVNNACMCVYDYALVFLEFPGYIGCINSYTVVRSKILYVSEDNDDIHSRAVVYW